MRRAHMAVVAIAVGSFWVGTRLERAIDQDQRDRDRQNIAYVDLIADAARRGERPDYCSIFAAIGHTKHSAEQCGAVNK